MCLWNVPVGGHLITWMGPCVGHLNDILARVGGNLNYNFQKSQMPRGLSVGGVEASIWPIHYTAGRMVKWENDRQVEGEGQPRPQGAFPWLRRWGEKRPGDEVGRGREKKRKNLPSSFAPTPHHRPWFSYCAAVSYFTKTTKETTHKRTRQLRRLTMLRKLENPVICNLRSGPIWAVLIHSLQRLPLKFSPCPPECNFQSETKIGAWSQVTFFDKVNHWKDPRRRKNLTLGNRAPTQIVWPCLPEMRCIFILAAGNDAL